MVRQTDRQTHSEVSAGGERGRETPIHQTLSGRGAICIYSRIGRCHGTEDKLIKSRGGDALYVQSALCLPQGVAYSAG